MLLLIILLIISFIDVKSEFSGWIDPDTEDLHKKLKSFSNGIIYDLVMSDEFNIEGRSFKDGHDPTWTAIDKSDDDQTSSGKKSLQYYNSSNVYTLNGSLIIETNDHDTKWKGFDPYKKKYSTMSRHFKSGMVQSWNKFCYTGGILELDVKFPGAFDVGGLWPAAWIMGMFHFLYLLN
jgi:beta-glucanase (GH16 family)